MAVGNSAGKKDAMANAARDFCSFLVRTGEMNQGEVPGGDAGGGGWGGAGEAAFTGAAGMALGLTNRPNMFEEGFGPRALGPAYQMQGQEPGQGDFKKDFLEKQNKQSLADAEDSDPNAAIHGHWTMENAKSMLHQFIQTRNIRSDYVYTMVGMGNFVAEMSFYVRELQRNVTARGQASNKHIASKSCALSLVRQLFHLGVIEAFSGTLKKNKSLDEMPAYEVALSPELVTQLESCLEALDSPQVSVADYRGDEGPPGAEQLSLLPDASYEDLLPPSTPQQPGIVSWSPPQQNWNPWLGANIDEGALATASLDSICQDLNTDWAERQKTDAELQAAAKKREELPIFAFRTQILETINEHPVTLVRGNTGCGKTTQVCQYILDEWVSSGSGAHCNIVCTQPRRISAVSVADRVSTERAEQLGQSTGYSVRFESVLPRPYGAIMFCTVGVLLKKMEGGLRGVSHVIVVSNMAFLFIIIFTD